MSHRVVLPLQALAALLALLLASALLVARQGPPPLAAHIAFALGVMPLILGAMSYFVPVLTRGAGPGIAAWASPLLAASGGVLAVTAFATDNSSVILGFAAALGALATLGLGVWAANRTKHMLGPRHSGLDWYLAALGMLLLGLLAIVLMPLFAEQRAALRLFHVHANMLGFVGLTALGTLQVLLPTCLGRADPTAAVRLRRDIKWAAGGALSIALGVSSLLPHFLAAAALPLALMGTLLYAVVILRMLRAWQIRFGSALLAMHGAAASLLAAAVGLLCLLALGAAHGLGWLPARPAIVGFAVAFLLPLVSAAAGQLLPVWLRPGVQGPWHRKLRTRLCRWSALRGLLLLLLGLLLTLS